MNVSGVTLTDGGVEVTAEHWEDTREWLAGAHSRGRGEGGSREGLPSECRQAARNGSGAAELGVNGDERLSQGQVGSGVGSRGNDNTYSDDDKNNDDDDGDDDDDDDDDADDGDDDDDGDGGSTGGGGGGGEDLSFTLGADAVVVAVPLGVLKDVSGSCQRSTGNVALAAAALAQCSMRCDSL